MKEDSFYKVIGNNLHCNMLINLEDALCGLEREFILPCGTKHRFKLDDVIHPNDVYSIVGYGLKDSHNRIGDIQIEFKISFPNKIDKERKVYLQKLLKKYNSNHTQIDLSLDTIIPIKMSSDRNIPTESTQEESMYNDPLFEAMEGSPQCAQQ